MKIVMVAPFGLRPKGTVRVRALPLAGALVDRGHEVTLLVPPWDDRAQSGKRFEQQGVRVRHVRLPHASALDLPALSIQLTREALAARPDILHTFKPKAYSGLVALAWRAMQRAGRVSAPLVVDTDDWEGAGGWNDLAPYSGLQKRFFAWQEQWGLRHADGITAASRALETVILSLGVEPQAVAYIPNGPGVRQTHPPEADVARLRRELALGQAPVALLYTRFFEFDVARMAHLWARIVGEIPDARLLVVGKGQWGEEKTFHRAIAERGVSDTVVDAGWQPEERLPALLAVAQVALYPMADTLLNRAKCPVKLADYLQAGLPVVGEAVGQVVEYLGHDANRLLVRPGDDGAFVSATTTLLRNSEEARTAGALGRTRLEQAFAWPIAAERLERLYRNLLAV